MQGFKHGLRYTEEYCIWLNMINRCSNPINNNKYYENIVVCDDWYDPVNFIKDMGNRPTKQHQIDRIDNTKGYNKENCRWVDKTTQMRNTRISNFWYVNRIKYESLSDASEKLGIPKSTIQSWCGGKRSGKYNYPAKEGCWTEKKYVNNR